uniref:hypothetical protein n=1 Tax=Parafrigoribacterium mesophilum TaxID=433646 RepID=UPI0031FBF115
VWVSKLNMKTSGEPAGRYGNGDGEACLETPRGFFAVGHPGSWSLPGGGSCGSCSLRDKPGKQI